MKRIAMVVASGFWLGAMSSIGDCRRAVYTQSNDAGWLS